CKSSSICNNWQLCCLRTPGLPGGIYRSKELYTVDSAAKPLFSIANKGRHKTGSNIDSYTDATTYRSLLNSQYYLNGLDSYEMGAGFSHPSASQPALKSIVAYNPNDMCYIKDKCHDSDHRLYSQKFPQIVMAASVPFEMIQSQRTKPEVFSLSSYSGSFISEYRTSGNRHISETTNNLTSMLPDFAQGGDGKYKDDLEKLLLEYTYLPVGVEDSAWMNPIQITQKNKTGDVETTNETHFKYQRCDKNSLTLSPMKSICVSEEMVKTTSNKTNYAAWNIKEYTNFTTPSSQHSNALRLPQKTKNSSCITNAGVAKPSNCNLYSSIIAAEYNYMGDDFGNYFPVMTWNKEATTSYNGSQLSDVDNAYASYVYEKNPSSQLYPLLQTTYESTQNSQPELGKQGLKTEVHYVTYADNSYDLYQDIASLRTTNYENGAPNKLSKTGWEHYNSKGVLQYSVEKMDFSSGDTSSTEDKYFVTYYDYDAWGRVIKETNYSAVSSSQVGTRQGDYHQSISYVYEPGVTTIKSYAGSELVATRKEYFDGFDNLVKVEASVDTMPDKLVTVHENYYAFKDTLMQSVEYDYSDYQEGKANPKVQYYISNFYFTEQAEQNAIQNSDGTMNFVYSYPDASIEFSLLADTNKSPIQTRALLPKGKFLESKNRPSFCYIRSKEQIYGNQGATVDFYPCKIDGFEFVIAPELINEKHYQSKTLAFVLDKNKQYSCYPAGSSSLKQQPYITDLAVMNRFISPVDKGLPPDVSGLKDFIMDKVRNGQSLMPYGLVAQNKTISNVLGQPLEIFSSVDDGYCAHTADNLHLSQSYSYIDKSDISGTNAAYAKQLIGEIKARHAYSPSNATKPLFSVYYSYDQNLNNNGFYVYANIDGRLKRYHLGYQQINDLGLITKQSTAVGKINDIDFGKVIEYIYSPSTAALKRTELPQADGYNIKSFIKSYDAWGNPTKTVIQKQKSYFSTLEETVESRFDQKYNLPVSIQNEHAEHRFEYREAGALKSAHYQNKDNKTIMAEFIPSYSTQDIAGLLMAKHQLVTPNFNASNNLSSQNGLIRKLASKVLDKAYAKKLDIELDYDYKADGTLKNITKYRIAEDSVKSSQMEFALQEGDLNTAYQIKYQNINHYIHRQEINFEQYYSRSGLLLQQLITIDANPVATYLYAYNAQNQLSQFECKTNHMYNFCQINTMESEEPTSFSNLRIWYDYNNLGLLQSVNINNQQTLGYDYNSENPFQLKSISTRQTPVVNFSYNELGQVTQIDKKDPQGKHLSTTQLSYNLAGNVINYKKTGYLATELEYHYDPLGYQLAEIGKSGVNKNQSNYNIFIQGNLVSQYINGKEKLIVPGGAVVQDHTNNSLYYAGNITNGQTQYGSWAKGGLQSLLTYLPFGASYSAITAKPRSHDLDVKNNTFGYNLQRDDQATGIQFLGTTYNRPYDPEYRVFLSPDSASPWGVGGFSPYAYVNNDPVNNFDPTGHYLQPISGGDRVADAGNLTAMMGGLTMLVPGGQAIGLAMMVSGVATAVTDYAASGETDAVAQSIMSVIPVVGEAIMIGDTVETAQQIQEGNIGNEAEAIGQLTQMWAMTVATTVGGAVAGSRGVKESTKEVSFKNSAPDNIASNSTQAQNVKSGIDFEAEVNKEQKKQSDIAETGTTAFDIKKTEKLYEIYKGRLESEEIAYEENLTFEEFAAMIKGEVRNLASQKEYSDAFDIKAGLLERYDAQNTLNTKISEKYASKLPTIEEAPELMAEIKSQSNYNYEGVAQQLIENYERLSQDYRDKKFFGSPMRRSVADTFGTPQTELGKSIVRNDIANTIQSMKNNPQHAKYYEIYKNYNYDMR
ncbi:RHS repeat domain-containing protein, partial [Cysteiniphilum litorale]|uniref:RHS repeat domain-containing protein n=1 Tax=Cysteiniphilum litorale TaxID=2056700 RepID=UPI003F883DAD